MLAFVYWITQMLSPGTLLNPTALTSIIMPINLSLP
jgi:hypothetical protein